MGEDKHKLPTSNETKTVTSDTAEPMETTELMDLPEPVLLKILSYLGHDFLRHKAARVSMEWRRLARSRPLWSTAELQYAGFDCWDKFLADVFVKDLLATPYLQHLLVNFENEEAEMHPIVLPALLATRCKIYKLTLEVKHYNDQILLFLLRHPELRKLVLKDNAGNDECSASVAMAVGALVPRLISLDISFSRLLYSRNGEMLSMSSAQPKFSELMPSADCKRWPAGSEPEQPVDSEALDLEDDGEDEDSACARQVQKEGLQCIKYESDKGIRAALHSYENFTHGEALDLEEVLMLQHLEALLLANRHSLQRVFLSVAHRDIFLALAECPKLQVLSVSCGLTGEDVCAMLEAMKSRLDGPTPTPQVLRSLRLLVPGDLGVGGVTTVLETVCRCAPLLEKLELVGACWMWPPNENGIITVQDLGNVFPGFAPMRGMLLGRPGRAHDAATLRQIRITDLGFVGRKQLLELVAIADEAAGALPLRNLEVSECPCSEECSWRDCRDRAEDALRAAVPDLDFAVSSRFLGRPECPDFDFCPFFTCDCDHGV